MPQPSPVSSPSASSAPNPAPDLGLTMTQVLRNPLSALRASMETLASEFRADDPRSLKLSGALEQVLSMSRDVDALMALTAPRPLAPLTCAVDEILESSLRRQGFEQRARVRLARPSTSNSLRVDGPLLADCLARLLEHALATSTQSVLLSAQREGDATRFSIVAESEHEGAAWEQLPSQRRAALELGLALARRDVQRMNAQLDIAHSNLGHVRLSLSVRDAVHDEDPAAS